MTANDGLIVGVTPVVDNGPKNQRLNLVLVAEGFTERELPYFASACANFARALFATRPFNQAHCGINIFRIDVVSRQSGIDDPCGTGAEVATYFDARLCAGGIQRAIAGDNIAVALAVSRILPEAHAILVLVNSTLYGGTAWGSIAYFTLWPGWEDVAIHELGHALFNLADEYDYHEGCASDSDRDRPPILAHLFQLQEPNVAGPFLPGQPTIASQLKWHKNIDPSTQIPTQSNPDCSICHASAMPPLTPAVGAYEGAATYHCGIFRSEFTCKMRESHQDFCQVCRDHILNQISGYYRLALWLINERFRKAMAYAKDNGFSAGFPTFLSRQHAAGELFTLGLIYKKQPPVVFTNGFLHAAQYGDPFLPDKRMAAAHTDAASRGFISGFPTYDDDPARGDLGVAYIRSGAVILDVLAGDLGNPRSAPDMFAGVQRYAVNNGYSTGYPTFIQSGSGSRSTYKCIMFPSEIATTREVSPEDLCPLPKHADPVYDVLKYNTDTGDTVLLFSTNAGGLTFGASQQVLQRSLWSIVSGRFTTSINDSIACFNRAAGEIDVFDVDDTGKLVHAFRGSGIEKTATLMVSGQFIDFVTSGLDGIALYSPTYNGYLIIHATDEDTGLSGGLTKSNIGTNWTHLVSGSFLDPPKSIITNADPLPAPDLILYDSASGAVQIYGTSYYGTPYLASSHGILPGYTHIISGNFQGAGTSFIFGYDSNAGMGHLYPIIQGQVFNPMIQYRLGNWSHIVMGHFGGGPLQDVASDLYFYDAVRGAQWVTRMRGFGLPVTLWRAPDKHYWTRVVAGRFGSR